MGHTKKDINARIRLYSSKNINHEEAIKLGYLKMVLKLQ